MSSGQPAVATRPPTGPSNSPDDGEPAPPTTRPEQQATPRDVVRLFQCRLCSYPLRDPVTLPCGRSLCRQCLPEPHEGDSTTHLAEPERSQKVLCPFEECRKEHALEAYGGDVLLNKALHYLRDSVGRCRDGSAKAGEATSAGADESNPTSTGDSLCGGNLAAIWSLAERGKLKYEDGAESIDATVIPSQGSIGSEAEALHKLQDEARTEMDCHICYRLLWDPLTAACGHTFCRSCLQRVLDYARYCPLCRRELPMQGQFSRTECPANERLTRMIETFWKDELTARKDIVAADLLGQPQDFDIPLFVCTLAFPLMPTFLYVFEPRYRLMIRRTLEKDGLFGMVLPSRSWRPGAAPFHPIGTLLRIVKSSYYPDGRCIIETVGVSRFRVTNHGERDGYLVAKVEEVADVDTEDEDASTPPETPPADGSLGSNWSPWSERRRRGPATVGGVDIESMSTADLMEYATSFVERMRARSVPWLTDQFLTVYGDYPNDPALFPWWLGSILPLRDIEKYRLLETTSVKDRLKICCSWIEEWDVITWNIRHTCVIF